MDFFTLDTGWSQGNRVQHLGRSIWRRFHSTWRFDRSRKKAPKGPLRYRWLIRCFRIYHTWFLTQLELVLPYNTHEDLPDLSESFFQGNSVGKHYHYASKHSRYAFSLFASLVGRLGVMAATESAPPCRSLHSLSLPRAWARALLASTSSTRDPTTNATDADPTLNVPDDQQEKHVHKCH